MFSLLLFFVFLIIKYLKKLIIGKSKTPENLCTFLIFFAVISIKFVKLSVIIDQRDNQGKLLFASQDGQKIELNSKNLIISYLKHPFMTFKIISAIHFEALRLWLKRIKFVKKVLKIKNDVSYENNESKRDI